MTLGEAVIVAENVDVVFNVYEDSASGLKQRFGHGKMRRTRRRVHAVKSVTVEAREGETIGLIGANGSGKSTLLAAMCGLIPLQGGRVLASSRPVLLGVGAALRPQLSGRQNLVIGGLALGMRRREIESQLDDLIEFTGLGDSIDLPMRTYSSGMRARLTFTIATAITPQILMIDEALAVGDEAFKARSEERINQIRGAAGTVFLVSHNLNEISSTCDRALWLDRGALRSDGPVDEVVAAYRDSVRAQSGGGG